MIVRFESSETGEVLMFAETARTLLQIVDKATTARGVFTLAEMPAAAEKLRVAIAQARREAAAAEAAAEEEDEKPKEVVVGLSQRAWPLLDMLERTGKTRDGQILWEASADF